ncbi:MAG: hypothetical protein KBD53_00350 [Candidatus Omnitrophica bacterium]|nr:hypothetical protein [Candidatus Omnitrophota bacterium]
MRQLRTHIIFRTFSAYLSLILVVTFVVPPQQSYAQSVLNLPALGTPVLVSQPYNPPIITGITIYPDNPLKFDFIIDPGDKVQGSEEFRAEANKLIEYFLTTLTVPSEQMWVNLSPYEKDRIIPTDFGLTQMGRDLLAQDYMLKQFSASLMNPDEKLGGKFWDEVYKKAQEQYGTTEIPMNTFNKIWIVPERADVYVNGTTVFVVDSHLKVMLEEDYLALEHNQNSQQHGLGKVTKEDIEITSGVSSEIVKNILIPAVEKEVNEGETFANLRQVYNSMILATWYKHNLQKSLLGGIFVNKGKVKGLEVEDKDGNEKIYEQYVESFKKGVHNFVRDEYDSTTQEMIPRKYFSGGINAAKIDAAILTSKENKKPSVNWLKRTTHASFSVFSLMLVALGITQTGEYYKKEDGGKPDNLEVFLVNEVNHANQQSTKIALSDLTQYLEHMKKTEQPLLFSTDINEWKRYLETTVDVEYFSDNLKNLGNDPKIFELFIYLYKIASYDASKLEIKDPLKDNGRLLKEAMLDIINDKNWQEQRMIESEETRKLRIFFEEVWSKYMTAVTDSSPNRRELEVDLVRKAKDISETLEAYMEYLVMSYQKEDPAFYKSKDFTFLKKWDEFEVYLLRNGFLGGMDLIEKKSGDMLPVIAIFVVDKEEKFILAGREIKVFYYRQVNKIDLPFHPLVAHQGAHLDGELFINMDYVNKETQNIINTLNGNNYLLTDSVTSSRIDQLIREAFSGMSPDEIKLDIINYIRVHEGEHAYFRDASSYSGTDYFKTLNDGLWDSFDDRLQIRIINETGAYLYSMAQNRRPILDLIGLGRIILRKQENDGYQNPYDYVATYIFNSVYKSLRKKGVKGLKPKKVRDARDGETIREMIDDMLMYPELLQQAAFELYNKDFKSFPITPPFILPKPINDDFQENLKKNISPEAVKYINDNGLTYSDSMNVAHTIDDDLIFTQLFGQSAKEKVWRAAVDSIGRSLSVKQMKEIALNSQRLNIELENSANDSMVQDFKKALEKNSGGQSLTLDHPVIQWFLSNYDVSENKNLDKILSQILIAVASGTLLYGDFVNFSDTLIEEKNISNEDREELIHFSQLLFWAMTLGFKNLGRKKNPNATDNKDKPLTGDPLGGIDFNPDHMQLNTQGTEIKYNLEFDPIKIQNIQIEGIQPVIINVAPVINIQMLLGESESDQENSIDKVPLQVANQHSS